MGEADGFWIEVMLEGEEGRGGEEWIDAGKLRWSSRNPLEILWTTENRESNYREYRVQNSSFRYFNSVFPLTEFLY